MPVSVKAKKGRLEAEYEKSKQEPELLPTTQKTFKKVHAEIPTVKDYSTDRSVTALRVCLNLPPCESFQMSGLICFY